MTYICRDDEIVPDGPEHAVLRTHALHYATSVFEGIRVYDGAAFALEAHMARLCRSAALVGLDLDADADRLAAQAEALIRANGLVDAYIRPVIFNAGPDMGVHAPDNAVTVAMFAWSWPSPFEADSHTAGITLTAEVPYRRPPPESLPVTAKTAAHYLAGAIDRRVAASRGFDDALMAGSDGFVAEATGANIFLVANDGRLVTPPPTCFLDGITRRTTIAIADELDLEVDEREVAFAELEGFAEVFLTGTAYEIQPVAAIDAIRYSPAGPVTRAVRDAYDARTGKRRAAPPAAE